MQHALPFSNTAAALAALPSAHAAAHTATEMASAASTPMTGTGKAFKADADMQAVLDELASLGGKPIETLTPAEARKQPTPADAVMSLLKMRGALATAIKQAADAQAFGGSSLCDSFGQAPR